MLWREKEFASTSHAGENIVRKKTEVLHFMYIWTIFFYFRLQVTVAIFNCYLPTFSYASYIYQQRPGFHSYNLICKLNALFLLCPTVCLLAAAHSFGIYAHGLAFWSPVQWV